MRDRDLSYGDAIIVVAVLTFFLLAFGHWLLGCSGDSSCTSNSDCPVGAYCDFTQPVGPICIPIGGWEEDSGTDGGTATATRLPLPCPICTSMEFPIGCIIGSAITCAASAASCPGIACDDSGSDSGSDASSTGSDSGTDAGSDAGTDATLPPSCGDPICTYDWCGTMYNQNCAPAWNGDGDCDCGCQFFDTDCGG